MKLLLYALLILAISIKIVASDLNVPSSLPTEQRKYVEEEYQKFMQQRQQEKRQKQEQQQRKQQQQQQQQQQEIPKDRGISPKAMNMKRMESNSTVALNDQVYIPGGTFWFGSQTDYQGKIAPAKSKDGAKPRKKASVRSFMMDVDCVTTEQFQEFVEATKYKTEAELFRWSFVIESQVSEAVKKEVDGPNGIGRVQNAKHWMAVTGASWRHPYGYDTDSDDYLNYPVIHVSYNDAVEYCTWAGRRLPTEKEWEYAARGGRVNQTFPWGMNYEEGMMNIWDGSKFPQIPTTLKDGYLGIAPVRTFPPNDYGLYNMLGNVWEWVKGGNDKQRIQRGGSFIDSIDGRFNHAVMVSTRHENSGDSSASNTGFRCASDNVPVEEDDEF